MNPTNASISLDDRYKSHDNITHLKFLLVDSQGKKITDYPFDIVGNHFSIDVIDLDNDGQKDFVFIIREPILSHIHKTMVIYRTIIDNTDLKIFMSVPYAGKTKDGTAWSYKHSYFKQDDGSIHIKLTPDKTSPKLTAKTRWINIADRTASYDLKQSEPPNPMQMCFRKEEYYIDNLLGDKGYTIRANPKKNSSPFNRSPLRSIQVIDNNESVVSERPFRAYYGGYWLALFDIDADNDKEFIFILQTGSGTGYMAFEMSIDKIVDGQFIPIVTFPIAVAGNQGQWGFTEWKYRGYHKQEPSEVVFELVLHYMTFPEYKGDSIPESVPREDSIILQFKQGEYIISTIYPPESEKRPRDNWRLGDSWIFK